MKRTMTKLLAGVLCSVAFASNVYADEGMWVLSMLNKRSQKQMKELGLKLSAKELYNPDGPSFKDAIVSFGGYCSGVVVSPDGLVFTNHHCGYGSIQEHSTPEHDYLKNGFVANSFKEELPNPDLHVSFLIKTVDVTDKVNAVLNDRMSEMERRQKVDSISHVLEKEAEAENKQLRAEVASYYQGNEYYLSLYKDYKDVRLVYAPPSSLGKLGGDTDNWMWPRHTCDFSVFRIYADKNNEPAEYSPENQPYKASAYAPVSLKGYKEGDYCMTMGYPGSTNRYLSSFGVDERMKTQNAAMIQIRGIKQDIWTSYMEKDAATRIKYASKFAQSSNYWKNSIGMNQSINDLGVIAQKQDLERRLQAWIGQHPDMQKKYGTMLPDLEKAYGTRFNAARASSFFYECFFGSAELPRFMMTLFRVNPKNLTPEMKEAVEATIGKYADMDVNIDKHVFATMLEKYIDLIPGAGDYIYNSIRKSCFLIKLCNTHTCLRCKCCSFKNDGIAACYADRSHPADHRQDHAAENEEHAEYQILVDDHTRLARQIHQHRNPAQIVGHQRNRRTVDRHVAADRHRGSDQEENPPPFHRSRRRYHRGMYRRTGHSELLCSIL